MNLSSNKNSFLNFFVSDKSEFILHAAETEFEMNVIYINCHDAGTYIEPYGYKIDTPNLTELASEGTLFRKAFCVGPTCSSSRAGLLTGQSAHSSGMLGLAHLGYQLKDYNNHIAKYLRSFGYETTLCGVHHIGVQPNMDVYSKYLDFEEEEKWQCTKFTLSRDRDIAKLAARYIEEEKSPFFLSVGFYMPHREYLHDLGKINADYVIPPFPIYDNEEGRKDFAEYMASAAEMDKCVGIVTNAVKNAGIEDETFIIFASDHGLPFPRMKANLYDTGIATSLIFKIPENKHVGRAVDAMVSHTDIFPTICDFLGIDKPDWLEGTSIMPLIKSEKDKIRDEIYSEVNYHLAYEPLRCVRTERYKYIKYFGEDTGVLQANVDNSYVKSFFVDNGWEEEEHYSEMLFDLYLDPVERVNLIGNPKYKSIEKDLKLRLKNWMEKTDDPLLKGKIEIPDGCYATWQDYAEEALPILWERYGIKK